MFKVIFSWFLTAEVKVTSADIQIPTVRTEHSEDSWGHTGLRSFHTARKLLEKEKNCEDSFGSHTSDKRLMPLSMECAVPHT